MVIFSCVALTFGPVVAAFLAALGAKLDASFTSSVALLVRQATPVDTARALTRAQSAQEANRRQRLPGRPHRPLNQAAPTVPLLANLVGLNACRVLRRDRAGGDIGEYQQVA